MKRLVIAIQSLLSRKKLTGNKVFLRPPKRRTTKTTRRTICQGPIANGRNKEDINNYFKQM